VILQDVVIVIPPEPLVTVLKKYDEVTFIPTPLVVKVVSRISIASTHCRNYYLTISCGTVQNQSVVQSRKESHDCGLSRQEFGFEQFRSTRDRSSKSRHPAPPPSVEQIRNMSVSLLLSLLSGW